MGLKDWLAKSAGVGAYGEVMGREAVKNGIALGRTLYLGHGTRATPYDGFVFEYSEHMRSEGFELYCADEMQRPPMEDPSQLSKHTRAAGIAFAATCCFVLASNLMKRANAEAFKRSAGSSTARELRELSSGISPELLTYYWDVQRSRVERTEELEVLNLESPGTNDILSWYLEELSKQVQGKAVGFQRRGVLGFDTIVVSLAEETVQGMREASQKFGW